ncbi:Omega-hydroxypalmitate O-feruloyl transferase [Camellia lanceoleosa]|uniref:Omega-hydroxypalmitate O-feruloyl transferase n=1 Tax=Camellia lanceoleosa TaxID=1840588 RepID=A0ACC0HE05_9ERIC|nr:Omega-hydroxypalmitate O-feruloyl transferase [Camellia lanceoleosa]
MTINHCMTDGISAMEFVHSWAETARSKTLTLPPFIDRTILRSREPPSIKYPHKEFQEITDTSNMSTLYQEDQLVYNSFQFNQEKIARLKKTAIEDGIIKNCTTFTVLTALVWRARTKALKMKPNQQSKLLFAVDGRSKFNPPLPKGYFGNGIVLTCCICNASELIEKPLSFVAEHVQNAIKMVTEGFIRSSIDYFEVTRARPSLTATLLVTSWTRLDFDTTDFGWGEAVQSGCVNLPEKEVALLLCNGRDRKITTLLLGLPITAMKTFQELMQV